MHYAAICQNFVAVSSFTIITCVIAALGSLCKVCALELEWSGPKYNWRRSATTSKHNLCSKENLLSHQSSCREKSVSVLGPKKPSWSSVRLLGPAGFLSITEHCWELPTSRMNRNARQWMQFTRIQCCDILEQELLHGNISQKQMQSMTI